jgi:hypothetical protein
MKLGSDPPAHLHLTPLERSVLLALAAGAGAERSGFEAQGRRAAVLSRSHSGVGFVTRLRVPEDVAALGETAGMHAVRALHPQLAEPAEFLVQVKAGRLASIEAFCGEGMWPEDETQFRIIGGPH